MKEENINLIIEKIRIIIKEMKRNTTYDKKDTIHIVTLSEKDLFKVYDKIYNEALDDVSAAINAKNEIVWKSLKI